MTSRHDGAPDAGHRGSARGHGISCSSTATDYATALAKFRLAAAGDLQLGSGMVRRHRRRSSRDQPALIIVEQDGGPRSWTYAELSARSDQVAGWLQANGVGRGDRIVLMLGNQIELWEIMLAAIKLGAVIIPASTLLTPADLADRVAARRCPVRHRQGRRRAILRRVPGTFLRIAVGRPVARLDRVRRLRNCRAGGLRPDGDLAGGRPAAAVLHLGHHGAAELVEHSQVSYPIGHLSTMYWIGLQPGDVHLNISSPGWAKHAWSSVFAPWLAGATVLVHNYTRFDAAALMQVMAQHRVTTFCAPPTVWRMLIQADLSRLAPRRGKLVGAGEPLNPEVIEQVRAAWGVDHPGRLRADRDDAGDRQFAGSAGPGRLDGPADARVTGSRCSTRRPASPATRARSASTWPPGPSAC